MPSKSTEFWKLNSAASNCDDLASRGLLSYMQKSRILKIVFTIPILAFSAMCVSERAFAQAGNSEVSSKEGRDLSKEVLRLNQQLARNPESANTKPLLKGEIVEAIKRLFKPDGFSDEEFSEVKGIAESGTLPNHIQLRQFVRYHTGHSMQHGRWVRLIVQRKNYGAHAIQIRNEKTFERPLTQRERWAVAEIRKSGSVALLNRFVSWFEEDPSFNESVEQSIDYQPLASAVRAAFDENSVDKLLEHVHWDGVERNDRVLVREEMERLLQRGLQNLDIEPKRYLGQPQQAQSFLAFEPNVPVEAYLKLTFVGDEGREPKSDSDAIWLELGSAEGQARFVCYVVSSDRTTEVIGKPMSGPLSSKGGFNVLIQPDTIESGFELEAPKELDHINRANFELWKWPGK